MRPSIITSSSSAQQRLPLHHISFRGRGREDIFLGKREHLERAASMRSGGAWAAYPRQAKFRLLASIPWKSNCMSPLEEHERFTAAKAALPHDGSGEDSSRMYGDPPSPRFVASRHTIASGHGSRNRGDAKSARLASSKGLALHARRPLRVTACGAVSSNRSHRDRIRCGRSRAIRAGHRRQAAPVQDDINNRKGRDALVGALSRAPISW